MIGLNCSKQPHLRPPPTPPAHGPRSPTSVQLWPLAPWWCYVSYWSPTSPQPCLCLLMDPIDQAQMCTDFLACPQTCRVTMDQLASLGSWLNLAMISGPALLTLLRCYRMGPWLANPLPCQPWDLPCLPSLRERPGLNAPWHEEPREDREFRFQLKTAVRARTVKLATFPWHQIQKPQKLVNISDHLLFVLVWQLCFTDIRLCLSCLPTMMSTESWAGIRWPLFGVVQLFVL